MKRNRKKIVILGCGWVGSALKEQLMQKGCEVNCLSKDIYKNRDARVYSCEVLVIAIPPRGNYLDVIAKTMQILPISVQTILLSSISFYNNKKSVIDAEELVKLKDKNSVILRLGGLMGYDRVAGRYTEGKTVENKVTNYIHRDDVVGVIISIIEQNIKDKTFNVVAPIQCMRREIFLQNSREFGFEETYFFDVIDKRESLSSKELCSELGYRFKKEEVKEFWN